MKLPFLKQLIWLPLSGGNVTVLHVGETSADPTIRKALAIGANDAVRINAVPRDGSFVAHQIADYVRKNPVDMILCGRESSDYNGASVPAMISALLDIPCILFAKSLVIEGSTAVLENEIEGGKEIISTPLPFVAGASEGMADWKIPNMRGIMSARTKPLVVVDAIEVPQHTQVNRYDKPVPRSAVKLIPAEDAGTLFEILRKEKKVI